MPKALQHNYPGWQDDPHAEDSNGESREIWHGALRSVSAKRARKLRKRGVPLMPLHAVHTVTYSTPCGGALRVRIEPTTPNGRARYAWFECKDDAETRARRRAANCYEAWREAEQGLRGRRVELQERLESQRADHAAHEYFRKGGKLAATTYFQTFERHGLYTGVIHENVLQGANPQLDLYAAAFRSMRETEQVATEWGGAHYTRTLLRDATPEQLDAAARVDMTSYHEGLERAKLADFEAQRYAKLDGDGRLRVENPLQRATRETMLQAERDGLVQRVVSFARADGGVDEVDPFGHVTVHVPALLQREDETDSDFVQRHLAAGNVPEPPTQD